MSVNSRKLQASSAGWNLFIDDSRIWFGYSHRCSGDTVKTKRQD